MELKEYKCNNCGVIFEIVDNMPEIECTCKSKEFTQIK